MKKFSEIEARAASRHGGEAGLKEKIAEYDYMNNAVAVADTPDDRFWRK